MPFKFRLPDLLYTCCAKLSVWVVLYLAQMNQTVSSVYMHVEFSHLFGHCVPVQVTLTHVHPLLVQELALIRNQQSVTHKFTHCTWRHKDKQLTQTCTQAHISPSVDCVAVPCLSDTTETLAY